MKTIKKTEEAPEGYVNAIFAKFLEKAELANLSDAEQTAYAASLMHYKDQQGEITAGREEGREERTVEIAKNLLAKGTDKQAISEVTGLSAKELKKL